jgi:hypothetical protein
MNVRLSYYHEDENALSEEPAWQAGFSRLDHAAGPSGALFCDETGRTTVLFDLIDSVADREVAACSSIKYTGQEGQFDIPTSDFDCIDTPIGFLLTTCLRFDLFADPLTLTFAIPPCKAKTTLVAPNAVLLPRDQPLGCLVQRGLEHNFVILEPLEHINAFVQLTTRE